MTPWAIVQEAQGSGKPLLSPLCAQSHAAAGPQGPQREAAGPPLLAPGPQLALPAGAAGSSADALAFAPPVVEEGGAARRAPRLAPADRAGVAVQGFQIRRGSFGAYTLTPKPPRPGFAGGYQARCMWHRRPTNTCYRGH